MSCSMPVQVTSNPFASQRPSQQHAVVLIGCDPGCTNQEPDSDSAPLSVVSINCWGSESADPGNTPLYWLAAIRAEPIRSRNLIPHL
jgi:hypothetical protein